MSESITPQPELPFEEPERWLPAVGYEGFYEVSDLGRVRSVPHPSRTGFKGGVIRKPQNAGKGYRALRLSVRGHLTGEYVHHMVLAAFVGPCPAGMECLHGDDDRTNNRLNNLSYGTHDENMQQAVERNRMLSGERNPGSVLTEELVAEIRSAADAGVQGVALADYHGVSKATICRVVRRYLWQNVA
jgi:hypothetical protein